MLSMPTAEQALLEAQCYLSLQQNCSRCSYRRMDVVVELLKMNVGDDGVAASDVEDDELGQQSFANDDVLLMTTIVPYIYITKHAMMRTVCVHAHRATSGMNDDNLLGQ